MNQHTIVMVVNQGQPYSALSENEVSKAALHYGLPPFEGVRKEALLHQSLLKRTSSWRKRTAIPFTLSSDLEKDCSVLLSE